MLRKLALLLFAIHSAAIAIPKVPSDASVQIAIIAPEKAGSFPPPTSQIHEKRYYYLETVPDEDELEVLLKEKTMREAGFVSTSPESSTPQSTHFSQKQKLHNSPPDPEAPITSPMHPSAGVHLDSGSREQPHRLVITYRWEHATILWPPFGFFVVGSAVVCFVTILRSVRAKT
ncbi:uncharacterized protein N7529_010930 [Penicillium soppii]|uniref:uncharacterized protein n=1 Tax=Penicillium soppii TaxID=69789 RepID=UPI0025471938|nr:uncharacterized protein N7529_010930 [Penicillium soppii]KAJ5851545.1 hypothetical protein N7529_010930 [Penicillium soppii]